MFRIHFITGNTMEKVSFGVIRICLQKSNPCLKKMYYYSEFANNNKKIAQNVGNYTFSIAA